MRSLFDQMNSHDKFVMKLITGWGAVVLSCLLAWVVNLTIVIKTVFADGYVWADTTFWTGLEIAAVFIWPLSLITTFFNGIGWFIGLIF